jgi:hypothetical protein
MAEAPRSNRPTPRTPAAVEAELRRRIRAELAQAREAADDGALDDARLAEIIARAVAAALEWHLEAPEHARNATLSSRSWRPAGGPRGADRTRDYDDRPPRDFERGPRRSRDVDEESGFPRDAGSRPRDGGFQPRDGGFKPRDGGFKSRDAGFKSRDGGFKPRRGGGGFAPRRRPR